MFINDKLEGRGGAMFFDWPPFQHLSGGNKQDLAQPKSGQPASKPRAETGITRI